MEIPNRCEEDEFLAKKEKTISKIYGVSLDISVFPLKSYESYSRRSTNKFQLTFCDKECLIEFIKKFVNDNGTLEFSK